MWASQKIASMIIPTERPITNQSTGVNSLSGFICSPVGSRRIDIQQFVDIKELVIMMDGIPISQHDKVLTIFVSVCITSILVMACNAVG